MKKGDYCLVKASIANLYKNPSFTSELVTQALIWEKLIICDKKDNWFQVKQRDGYIAWVHSFYVIDSSIYDNNELLNKKENWYFIRDRLLEIKINDNEKYFLPFGALVPCITYDNNLIVILPDGEKADINKQKLLNSSESITFDRVLELSKSLLGIPYLWGGKSSFGYDCSGFVQTLFNIFGINFPRDSYQQLDYEGLFEIDYFEAKVGDLLFFADNKIVNHVAICIGNEEIIHSSGCVKIEKLKENKELYKKLYKIMSIRNIINE